MLNLLLLALCLLSPEARAASFLRPAVPTSHHSAVLLSPIGPVVAGVASALGTPAVDANLRMHHIFGEGVGMTLQTDFLWTRVMDVEVMSPNLRGGPRFSLRKRGLADWTLTPFAMVGYTTLSAAHEELFHYTTLGLGAEAGRTWVWKRLTMELGLGAYTTVPVAYHADAEVLPEQRPARISPVKPTLIWSLGYAF